MAHMALGRAISAPMWRKSLSCMLAGALLVFPAAVYVLADPDYQSTGTIIAAVMLVFCMRGRPDVAHGRDPGAFRIASKILGICELPHIDTDPLSASSRRGVEG